MIALTNSLLTHFPSQEGKMYLPVLIAHLLGTYISQISMHKLYLFGVHVVLLKIARLGVAAGIFRSEFSWSKLCQGPSLNYEGLGSLVKYIFPSN